jgi:RNA-directed DNA polymerase
MVLLSSLSRFLCIEEKEILEKQKVAQYLYKYFTIPKRDGSRRKIFHPSVFVKNIQYALIQIVFSKIKISNSAYGFVRGLTSPLLLNAQNHAKYKYTLCIDIKNFFLSIEPECLFNSIERNGDWPNLFKLLTMSGQDKDIIKNYCFIRNCQKNRLAIGSPSSPIISNIVMRSFDMRMNEMATERDGAYSRYADDIVVSYNEKEIGEKVYADIVDILKKELPKLTINEKKTRFFSKKKRRVITGLVIGSDSSISIGREKKREVKDKVYKYLNNKLDDKDIIYLSGYISYIRDVDSNFFNYLFCKYGPEVMNKIIGKKQP